VNAHTRVMRPLPLDHDNRRVGIQRRFVDIEGGGAVGDGDGLAVQPVQLRTDSVKWVLVEKFANSARCFRGTNLFRRWNRVRFYSALGSGVVSLAAQAPGQSPGFVLWPGLDHSLRADDNRRLERLASWRRLVRSNARHYNFPDSTRAQRRLAGDFLWLALAWRGLDRNHPSVGSDSRQHNCFLENLNSLRWPSHALPGMGYVHDIFECGNLALQQIA
jgi:hypothetical protein